MVEIILEAAHNLSDKQATDPEGRAEYILNKRVIDKIKDYMKLIDNCKLIILDSEELSNIKTTSAKNEYVKITNPDAFISIHHNNVEGNCWNKHYKGISVSMAAGMNNIESKSLADSILENLYINMASQKYTKRNVSITKYTLCKDNSFPSILISGPYISNYEDSDYAWSKECCEAYAKSVSDSLIKYFKLSGEVGFSIDNIDYSKPKVFIDNRTNYGLLYIDEEICNDFNAKEKKIVHTYVVRRSYDEKDTQKCKTTDIRRAILVCNRYYGYSVFKEDGGLVCKSTKAQVVPKYFKERSAKINNIGGLTVTFLDGKKALLQFGTEVKVINMSKAECTIKVCNNGIKFAKINPKFLKF